VEKYGRAKQTTDGNVTRRRKEARMQKHVHKFTFMLPCIVIDFFLNNQTDALIIQNYSIIKFYMFRASSLPIIRSFLLYIRHW